MARREQAPPQDAYIKKIVGILVALVFASLIGRWTGRESTYQSDWHYAHNLDLFHERLTEGDLLEYRRDFGYSHWAVYVGNKTSGKKNGRVEYYIIHMAVPKDANVSKLLDALNPLGPTPLDELWNKTVGKIYQATVESALVHTKVRVNNGMDLTDAPFDGPETVARARETMRKPVPEKYNLIFQNCEHFAHYCRYGKLRSRQIEKMTLDVLTRMIKEKFQNLF